MKVNLDKFEMYYLLESCFRGSHLRSDTILRFVDEWYECFTKEEREFFYKMIMRDIYNNTFKITPSLCNVDSIFMARFNPDNQYEVTVKTGEIINAFFMNGNYYILSYKYCDPDSIINVKKL